MKDKHYQDNKEHYARRNKERKASIHATIDELKRNPCTDCGKCFPPCAMDFDHLRDKSKGVSRLLNNDHASLSVIMKEISKCELVCAICHRIRTNARVFPVTDPSSSPA